MCTWTRPVRWAAQVQLGHRVSAPTRRLRDDRSVGIVDGGDHPVATRFGVGTRDDSHLILYQRHLGLKVDCNPRLARRLLPRRCRSAAELPAEKIHRNISSCQSCEARLKHQDLGIRHHAPRFYFAAWYAHFAIASNQSAIWPEQDSRVEQLVSIFFETRSHDVYLQFLSQRTKKSLVGPGTVSDDSSGVMPVP